MHSALKQTIIVLALISLFNAKGAAACNNGETENKPITLSEATRALDQHLLLSKQLPLFNKTEHEINDELKCVLDDLANSLPTVSGSAEATDLLYKNLIGAQGTEHKQKAITAINRSFDRDMSTGYVVLPSAETNTLSISLYKTLKDLGCTNHASSSCSQALYSSSVLWSLVGFYRNLGSANNVRETQHSLTYNTQLSQQWLSYKNDTIKLWPQEVLLNSIFYKQEKHGFTPPPSYKLLSLRPSLGLSYLSDDKNHIKPTLNVDILGVYWWQYDKSTATAQPGRGVAATVIWDGNDTAYGISYHHNPKWSFTLARGDENDVVLSFSFQLGYALFK